MVRVRLSGRGKGLGGLGWSPVRLFSQVHIGQGTTKPTTLLPTPGPVPAPEREEEEEEGEDEELLC